MPRAHLSVSRWPASAAFTPVQTSHGHPFARAHFNVSRRPCFAATAHVQLFHGHLFKRKYFSTLRWPCFAAAVHVSTSHEHPFSRAHFNVSRNPPDAASTPVIKSHGHPFARAHWSVSRWPPLAAAAHTLASHGQPFSRAHCNKLRDLTMARIPNFCSGASSSNLSLAKNSPTLVFVLESITRSSLSSFGTTRSRNTSRAWYMSPKRIGELKTSDSVAMPARSIRPWISSSRTSQLRSPSAAAMYEGMRIIPPLARLPGGGLDISKRPERRRARARASEDLGRNERPKKRLGLTKT